MIQKLFELEEWVMKKVNPGERTSLNRCEFQWYMPLSTESKQPVPDRSSAACFPYSPRFIVYKHDSYVGRTLWFFSYAYLTYISEHFDKFGVVMAVNKQHQVSKVYFEKNTI